MKICFHGWFSGFIERTNPGLHVGFFLDLFSAVYKEPCEIGSVADSPILCEFDSLHDGPTIVREKQWLHTYLFSGESTLKCQKSHYTCVLWGERNHQNIINVPLFVPYLYCNKFLETLQDHGHGLPPGVVPSKDVCVVVSNPRGLVRNKFLQKLEQVMRIDYAGAYKNNMNGCIPYAYNTPEFLNYVRQYKFIISMENSRTDTYITEKVIHGLLAQTIPVYWGSKRIHDYIRKERLLALMEDNSESEMDRLIQQMVAIRASPAAFLTMVNQPIFPSNKLERTLDCIARDVRCLVGLKGWNHISRIYCVSNPAFEPQRYAMLQKMFSDLNVPADNVSYISPTYKHTITDEVYNSHITEQRVLRLRKTPLKKSELSLFLNYIAVYEHIERNYKDHESLFFIFESDVMVGKDYKRLNAFLDFANTKRNEFDLIHVGMYASNIYDIPFMNSPTGYLSRNPQLLPYIHKNRVPNKLFIEDITNESSEFRLIRKFHTRCTDSFLWTYKGIVTFLNYMKLKERNYGTPIDYYMSNFFENNIDFKHYWSVDELFVQGSNLGLIETTLQN
jgi:hypothetical protein